MTSTDSIPTLFDPATCVRKGLCPVTSIRRQSESDIPPQSHSLYFELHGSGADKVVFIMGMNSSMFAWKAQVEYFGKHGGYSVLVFDNRGMGNSGTPKGPYTTSGMAEDVIVLLDYIGWTGPRAIHVVGMSLGGMIAQVLALHVSERIKSLSLIVTTPGGNLWGNIPPWKGLCSLARMMTITDPIKKIPIVLCMIFPPRWIDEKAEDDAQGRTNRQVQSEEFARRIAILRPQTLAGALSQMWAAWMHHVHPEQLKQIAQSVPKILILTGDEDHMVSPTGSERLWEGLTGWVDKGKDGTAQANRRSKGSVDFVRLENSGHAVTAQRPREVNTALEKVFREGNETAIQADSRME